MDYYVGKDFGKLLKRSALQMRRIMLSQNTDCMRVYDRNLVSLPITVDLYGQYARITDYSDGGLSDTDQRDVCDIAARMLYVEPQHVVFHERLKRQGKQQHDVLGDRSVECVVHEQGLSFHVDLTKRIDTGLFLDQAVARDGVRAVCAGLDVLNLFSYTGSFSVYAAAGGARSVTSVDLSSTYTEWCEKNLAANGFSGGAYPCVSQDAGEYIWKAVKERRKYGLIIFDPPSFSNSRKMEHDFDVQRDYVYFIRLLNGLLVDGGTLLFSTNLGSFRFETSRIHGYDVREITREVAAPGFSTKKNSLRSWILKKNQEVKAPLEEEMRVSQAAQEQTEEIGTEKVEAVAPVKAKKPAKAKKAVEVVEPVIEEPVVEEPVVEEPVVEEPVVEEELVLDSESDALDDEAFGDDDFEDADFDEEELEDDLDDDSDEEDDMLVLNWDEEESEEETEEDSDEEAEVEAEDVLDSDNDGAKSGVKNAAARRYERRHPGEEKQRNESSEAKATEYQAPAADRPRADRPSGDRPTYDRAPRSYDRDRAPRTFDRDRPRRPFDRDRPAGDRPSGDRPYDRDRAPRSFDRDRPRTDRPFDRDRPPRPFDRDRPSSDRPSGDRPYDRDRAPRSFDRDRPRTDRPFDRDRPPRPFDRDRPSGDRPYDRDRPRFDKPFDRDRAPRSFDRDRPSGDRPFDRDRAPRSFDRDRPSADRPFDRDRPPRRFDNDRPVGDRPVDRGPRPERTGGPKPYGFDKFKPTRTRGEDENFFWVDDEKKKED